MSVKGRDPNLRRHLTQAELALRWRISTRTLARWRSARTGPVWLDLNGRVFYRLEDVQAYECRQLRHPQP